MFDQAGVHARGNVRFRSAGGLPTIGRIPVHFLLSASDSTELLETVTMATTSNSLRAGIAAKVEQNVPREHGPRLIRLFHKNVFHILPIISRTEIGLSSLDSMPPSGILTKMPTYLLAALYATALPFCSEDEYLASVFAHHAEAQDELWDIVNECLQREMCRPKLSVLQAALLYLHRRTQHYDSPDTSNTPSMWTFLSSVIALAYNLGLHLECRMYAIPSREKRLRRRLWWATYIEDKWISLLLGRPPQIQHEECDVSDLDEADFQPPGVPGGEGQRGFQDMSKLALVARSLQSSLYSLKACQRLAEDSVALLQASKPIFDELKGWQANASAPVPFRPEVHSEEGNYPITVYFAYLILTLYGWRALIRSAAVSIPPPYIVDPDEQLLQNDQVQDDSALLQDFVFDLDAFPSIDLPDFDWSTDEEPTNPSALAKELYQAAQAWSEWLVDFAWCLSFHKVDEFWHSWSRIGFAVISNFLVSILVQAPSLQEALKARQTLTKWRRTVGRLEKASNLFSFARVQLDIHGSDIVTSFYLPDHVREALHHGNENT